MGKLLGMMVSVIAAICVATVIAAVVLIVFYAQSWKVNHARLVQAMAILQGKSPDRSCPRRRQEEEPTANSRPTTSSSPPRDSRPATWSNAN